MFSTIQSAEAYFLGMYPPSHEGNTTEVLDINTIDRKRDDMLINRDLCPVLRQYEDQALKSPHYLMHFSRYTQPLLQNLTTQLGFPVTLDNLAIFHDCLNTHFCHGFDIPISTEQYFKVREETAYMEYTEYTYPSRQAFSQAGLGHLLSEIMGYMQDSINANSAIKFYLLSGHDSTIMPMMTAFDIWDGQWTPYAAQMTFELYEIRASATAPVSYGVRLIYDGRVWTIRGCTATTADLCDFNSLLKVVAPLLPTGNPDACKITKPE
jgi:hypothetical protein